MSDERDVFRLPGPLEDGERLFEATGHWRHSVDLTRGFFDDYGYVEGFRHAAEVLCDQVLERRGDAEQLVMPILYCYRHWIELRLKDLWMLGGRWRGERVDPRRTHDLAELWRLVRPAIENAFPDDDPGELDRVESIVLELAAADPGPAKRFRYARDDQGRLALPLVDGVNVAQVREVMAKLARTLEGAAIGMEEMLSYADEGEYW